MFNYIELIEYSQVTSDKNTAESILLFGNDYDIAYEILAEDDLLPIQISYDRNGWLRDYLKSISYPLEPDAAPQLPRFSYEQLRWFDEQINHVPSDLRNQAYQKYKYASANGASDSECLRLSNTWLRETIEQFTVHPLAGTMHHHELTKQLIDNKYSAPDRALENFTTWILKNAGTEDGEIKNIARNISQQFHAQENDTPNKSDSDSISIINKQKLISKLGQFAIGNIDRNELIKQISQTLQHASQVFNITKFKKWSPNCFAENGAAISDFMVFTKQSRGERERNSESNPRCPTAWAMNHCNDQSTEHIEKLADDIICELNINHNLINESFMRNRLGVYADPFFREKGPIKPNEKNLRRQLRRAFRQANEMAALCLKKVSSRGQRYVSDFTLSKRTHQLNAQAAWIDRTICESGDKKIPLRSCVRTPEMKVAELLTLSDGLEKFCMGRGDKAMFVTLTAPSQYHPNPAYGTNNWDGSSPIETHQWFTENWRLFRTALSDSGIKIDGIRVTEPHRDGCPHYHILSYVKPSRYQKVIELFKEYFAHSDKAVEIEEIDPEKGSATGYLLKYVVKNTTGMSSDNKEDNESCARADAFRSTWGIRSFSHFGILAGRITTWRELRRLETQPSDAEVFAKSLWRAARASDAHKFIALLAHKDKKDEIKTIREPVPTGFTQPDDNGEIMPIILKGRILGIQINAVDYITHVTKWSLVSLIRTDDALENALEKVGSTVIHSLPSNPNPDPKPDPRDIEEQLEFA